MLEKEEATERCNVLQSMLDQTAKHEGIPGSSQPKLENRFSDVTLRESISVSPSGHSDLASGLVQSAEPPKLFKPSSTPRPKRSSSISQNISEIYAIGKELFGRREGIPPSQHSPLERALVETHSLEPGASPLQQPIPTSAESAHRSTPQPLLQRKLSIGNLLGMMPGVNATAEDAGTDHHNSSTRAPRRLGGPGDQAFVRSVDHGGEDGVAARGSVGSFFGGKQFKFKAKGAKVPASSATLLAEAAVEEPLTDAHSVDDVTPVEWTSYQPNKIRGTPTKCF
ncbi:uncharacterized protein BJ171DRAFT_488957, partial [Polychytrium aggregatum]|uniref:uncharacterized protein n=1 Tax=Polychytrium aggregatum TaxID=110093 RepID=UPI0022FE6E4E